MEQFSSLQVGRRTARVTTDSLCPVDRLTFPQESRARLDSSLMDVVVAAHRVQNTQTRLRELLTANRSVACYRGRTALLGGIVHSAAALVNAQWGVLEAYPIADHAGHLVRCGADAPLSAAARTIERYLQRDDQRFGILHLGRAESDDFSADDEQVLSSFSEMASIALFNMNQREEPGLVDIDHRWAMR
ncbi:GAF domain-containing protein [Frigoribacterium sp. UYMn621]